MSLNHDKSKSFDQSLLLPIINNDNSILRKLTTVKEEDYQSIKALPNLYSTKEINLQNSKEDEQLKSNLVKILINQSKIINIDRMHLRNILEQVKSDNKINIKSNSVLLNNSEIANDYENRVKSIGITLIKETNEVSPNKVRDKDSAKLPPERYFSLSSARNIFTDSANENNDQDNVYKRCNITKTSPKRNIIRKVKARSKSPNKKSFSKQPDSHYNSNLTINAAKHLKRNIISLLINNPQEAEVLKINIRKYHMKWKYRNFYSSAWFSLNNLKYIITILVNKSSNDKTEISQILFKIYNKETNNIFYQYIPISDIYPMKTSIEIEKIKNKYRFLIDLLVIDKGILRVKMTDFHRLSIKNDDQGNIPSKENNHAMISYIKNMTNMTNNDISNNFYSEINDQNSIFKHDDYSISRDVNDVAARDILSDLNLSIQLNKLKTMKKEEIRSIKEIFDDKLKKYSNKAEYKDNKEILDDVSVRSIICSSDEDELSY